MNDLGFQVRAASAGDRAAILELGPRLAEGVAPWRDQAEALLAGRRWLEGSLAAANAGDGAVLVAADEHGVAGVITIRRSTHFTGERDGYIGELVVAERASGAVSAGRWSTPPTPGPVTTACATSPCTPAPSTRMPAPSTPPSASPKRKSV